MRVEERTRRQWRGKDGLLLSSWEIGRFGGGVEIDVSVSPERWRPSRMAIFGEREWALDPSTAVYFESLWVDQPYALGGAPSAGGKARIGGRALTGAKKEIEGLWERAVSEFGSAYANAPRNPFDTAGKGDRWVKGLASEERSDTGPAFALSLFELGDGMASVIAHHSLQSYTGLLSETRDWASDKMSSVHSALFGATRGAVRPSLERSLANAAKRELKDGGALSAERVSAAHALGLLDRLFGFDVDRLKLDGGALDPQNWGAVILECRAAREHLDLEKVAARSGEAGNGLINAKGLRL